MGPRPPVVFGEGFSVTSSRLTLQWDLSVLGALLLLSLLALVLYRRKNTGIRRGGYLWLIVTLVAAFVVSLYVRPWDHRCASFRQFRRFYLGRPGRYDSCLRLGLRRRRGQ